MCHVVEDIEISYLWYIFHILTTFKMPSQKSSVSYLVLGGVSLLAIGGLAYLYINNNNNNNNNNHSNKPPPTSSGKKQKVEDETAEDVDGEVGDAAEKKIAYDGAISVAKKLMAGSSYLRAAEKYGEAILLAEGVPSAAKDVLTLYNNRSAMYEKAGELDHSMNDITVVLALDGLHLKARIRRARIFETTGKLYEALDDYVMAMFIERAKNLPPTTTEKADEVCKLVASKETAALLAAIRDPPQNAPPVATMLPTKSYCRTFFEALPSIYRWREEFKSVDRDELVKKWKTALKNVSTDKLAAGTAALELACYDFSRNAFTKGFETVTAALEALGQSVDSPVVYDASLDSTLSQLFSLKGTESLLMRRDRVALKALKRAVAHGPENLDAHLTFALCRLEMVQVSEAESIYTECLAKNDEVGATEGSSGCKTSRTSSSGLGALVRNAWVLVHRAAMWISREDDGNFRSGAIAKAMADIDASLKLTGKCGAAVGVGVSL